MACVLNFILILRPSKVKVLVWRFGFHTFLVWRCEKLTLLPYCFPLPVSSHLYMIYPLFDYRFSTKLYLFFGDGSTVELFAILI